MYRNDVPPGVCGPGMRPTRPVAPQVRFQRNDGRFSPTLGPVAAFVVFRLVQIIRMIR